MQNTCASKFFPNCKYALGCNILRQNPATVFSPMKLFYGVFLHNSEPLYQIITFWCRAINNVQSYLQDKKCVYLLAFRKYFVWYCSHSNSKTNSSSCQKKSVIVHLGLDLMSKRERFNFSLFVWSSKGKTVVKILQLAIKLSAFMGYEKRVAGFSPHLFNFWWQSLKPLLHLFYKITPVFMWSSLLIRNLSTTMVCIWIIILHIYMLQFHGGPLCADINLL